MVELKIWGQRDGWGMEKVTTNLLVTYCSDKNEKNG